MGDVVVCRCTDSPVVGEDAVIVCDRKPSSVILNTILGNLHLVARNDGQDLTFWSLLAKHIDNER